MPHVVNELAVRDVIVQTLAKLPGVAVTGASSGNGTSEYADLTVRLESGHEVYILIEHFEECDRCFFTH